VAEYNVLAMFHELMFNERYKLPERDEKTKEAAATQKKEEPNLQGRFLSICFFISSDSVVL
jgi:hypothetical protein